MKYYAFVFKISLSQLNFSTHFKPITMYSSFSNAFLRKHVYLILKHYYFLNLGYFISLRISLHRVVKEGASLWCQIQLYLDPGSATD